MSPVVDATTPDHEGSIETTVDAVRRGEVVVIPTDTVYGIGADAFDPSAVTAVLDAKGRGREMPPPVLIPDTRTVDGLARAVPEWARRLMADLWPGPLTLVLWAQPSLHWDLGETAGTVALRMGGNVLEIDGAPAAGQDDLTGEYPALYARMAELVRAGASEVDLAPMVLVADAFTLGRRHIVQDFDF